MALSTNFSSVSRSRPLARSRPTQQPRADDADNRSAMMKLSKNLQKLIDALAPYWAAEAAVVRAYFASKKRDRQSDLLWLARQCRKEFWDGFDEANPGLFIGPLQ